MLKGACLSGHTLTANPSCPTSVSLRLSLCSSTVDSAACRREATAGRARGSGAAPAGVVNWLGLAVAGCRSCPAVCLGNSAGAAAAAASAEETHIAPGVCWLAKPSQWPTCRQGSVGAVGQAAGGGGGSGRDGGRCQQAVASSVALRRLFSSTCTWCSQREAPHQPPLLALLDCPASRPTRSAGPSGMFSMVLGSSSS